MAGAPEWVVRGEHVGLTVPGREEFLARWDLYDDPRIAMVAAFQTTGAGAILKPPLSREQREGVWEAVVEGLLLAFDVRVVDDGRFIGEAGIARIDRPRASGDVAVVLFDPADRARGYGTEAVMLLLAYAFDGPRLNRRT